MTVALLSPPDKDQSVPRPARQGPHGVCWPELSTRWVVIGGLVAVALRLPYTGSPLRSDEGGFLLVASQWQPGSSLYGNYWVDRPPLLIAFYAIADRLGGSTALRLMGCGLVFSLTLLAHRLGRSVTRAPSLWPAVLALALLAMPWAGAFEVNGELIAVPLVIVGLIAAMRAVDEPARYRRWRMWATAGAWGTAALMVKQNFLDVLLFSAVLVVVSTSTSDGPPGRLRRATAELAALGIGATAAGSAIVLGAWTRGTTPAGLWDAIVVFRLDASRVIADSATGATDIRLEDLLLAMCLSGSVALILVFLAHAVRRGREPLVMATAALLAWELFGVLAGGSYWLHYLVGLFPGLVLAAAILASRTGRLGLAARTVIAYAAVVALVTALIALLLSPPTHEGLPAATWLEQHAQPGDTATLLYGAPHILQAAGLDSPYAQLWSLPVRVRDPKLAQLTAVLHGPDAPDWLLASNDLETWGVSSAPAFAEVTARYEFITTVDGYTVYHLQHSSPQNQRAGSVDKRSEDS